MQALIDIICYAHSMHPDFERAATLLQAIAGSDDEHIEMSCVGPAKYYTVCQHQLTWLLKLFGESLVMW